MNKKLLIITLFLIVCVFSVASRSDEKTLTIKGYKLGNLPADGILRVYVYDTTSSESSTTKVDDELDVTNYLNNYISGFKNIFSIKIQTNLVSPISVVINFSPFTSQDKTKTSISTSYYLKTSAGSYTNANKKSSYYYTYSASMSTFPDSFKNSSGVTVSTSSSNATVSQSISAKRGKNKNGINYTYTLTSKTTLDNIDSNATVDSTIYVYMKLNTTYNDILANVKYIAPVKITVTTE